MSLEDVVYSYRSDEDMTVKDFKHDRKFFLTSFSLLVK